MNMLEEIERLKEIEEGIMNVGKVVGDLNTKILGMAAECKDLEELRRLSDLHRLVVGVGNSAIDAFSQACFMRLDLENK